MEPPFSEYLVLLKNRVTFSYSFIYFLHNKKCYTNFIYFKLIFANPQYNNRTILKIFTLPEYLRLVSVLTSADVTDDGRQPVISNRTPIPVADATQVGSRPDFSGVVTGARVATCNFFLGHFGSRPDWVAIQSEKTRKS
jgi:hypothetical protein